MGTKYRTISMVCGTCGIIGGILIVVAAFMEEAFPRPLWLVAAICMFLNVIGIFLNYRYIHQKEKSDLPKEDK